ncbi:GIY-YIG nuclease family protein [Thalassospira sp. MCCC 1A01428]|uniref:GIY-YIG nuclease family protein n=1 Tax=Thalassospira sp. MCCC 1A01428 TaxID=1470575 RepID=UPI000A24327E|nr:GIY-YIG nuclease family protein [Thalassospira sp. MCCC 1A01428]OSQ44800.1 endonuclease [Thalassospira sp. MCCC 1A01428]
MVTGRSIRLFLVDGTPNGILTAEIMNWTGHVLSAPRTRLPDFVKRAETGRTGIYFLTGPDEISPNKNRVYVGESDNVANRLITHNNDPRKAFWDKACVISSKDQNLTKAHVRYLESRLINIIQNAGRAILDNNTAPEYGYLPESDLADMEFFIEQIRIVLPVLGLDFLRDKTKSEAPKPESSSDTLMTYVNDAVPTFVLRSKKHDLEATAQQINGDFVVLAGSDARFTWEGVKGGYEALHDQLVADKILVNNGENRRIFAEDYSFSSPSAASNVILGRSDNGRISWRIKPTGETYADWQNSQIEHSMINAET